MSEQTKPGLTDAEAAFYKRFREGGYQYSEGNTDNARAWFCYGYAAAAGRPREEMAGVYPTIARLADPKNSTIGYQENELIREAVHCYNELRFALNALDRANEGWDELARQTDAAPPAASADQSTEVASATRKDAGTAAAQAESAVISATSVDPAASAAPKAEPILRCGYVDGRHGEQCIYPARHPGQHRIATDQERASAPTPDDGRSDAELLLTPHVYSNRSDGTWEDHTIICALQTRLALAVGLLTEYSERGTTWDITERIRAFLAEQPAKTGSGE